MTTWSRVENLCVPTPREKLQQLLRELFQFENANLNFGVYRIMNHKRAMIESRLSFP
jgi:adenine-specific DNA-methyltransferase